MYLVSLSSLRKLRNSQHATAVNAGLILYGLILQVISIEDELKRQFYLTMAADQRWSKRTLKSKIDGMLYERTAIAKQPDEVILHDLELLRNERKMSVDLAFQDPYFIDFLGLEGDFPHQTL